MRSADDQTLYQEVNGHCVYRSYLGLSLSIRPLLARHMSNAKPKPQKLNETGLRPEVSDMLVQAVFCFLAEILGPGTMFSLRKRPREF